MEWQRGKPAKAGYYLGAWDNGGNQLMTSELWFNPDSTGTGWWNSRRYLTPYSSAGENVKVVAWMLMPVCKHCPTCGR